MQILWNTTQNTRTFMQMPNNVKRKNFEAYQQIVFKVVYSNFVKLYEYSRWLLVWNKYDDVLQWKCELLNSNNSNSELANELNALPRPFFKSYKPIDENMYENLLSNT